MNVTVDLAKLGIEQLSAMQLRASDSIAQGERDVILLSPTGSGKTLAYLLPILQKLDVSSKEVQAVARYLRSLLPSNSASFFRQQMP